MIFSQRPIQGKTRWRISSLFTESWSHSAAEKEAQTLPGCVKTQLEISEWRSFCCCTIYCLTLSENRTAMGQFVPTGHTISKAPSSQSYFSHSLSLAGASTLCFVSQTDIQWKPLGDLPYQPVSTATSYLFNDPAVDNNASGPPWDPQFLSRKCPVNLPMAEDISYLHIGTTTGGWSQEHSVCQDHPSHISVSFSPDALSFDTRPNS